MKSFLLSSIYIVSLVAAVDRFQTSSQATWLSGGAPLGANWFVGCALLLFCLVLLVALNELMSTGDRAAALKAGLFHGGLSLVAYVIWRTGMASLNPWCTGGRLCASRELETWPLASIFALGLALFCASNAFRTEERAATSPLRAVLKRRRPQAYVER